MTTQQLIFQETIAGLKRALKRERDPEASESDEPIDRPTNRDRKRKRGARHVQEGRLDNSSGPRVYKRKIEHAGYQRYIISRNPPRLDEDGDEIEEDEDVDNDATSSEDNVYGGVKLQVLLRPLTSAAELPTHPSLSVPYHSKALTEMVHSAQESLHREKATLWRMKHLLTQLRGDDTWIPCGAIHTAYDDWLLKGQRTLTPPAPSAASAPDHIQQPVLDSATVSDTTRPVESETSKATPSVLSTGRQASPLAQAVPDIQMGDDASVQDFMAEAARIASGGDVGEPIEPLPTKTNGDVNGVLPDAEPSQAVDAATSTATAPVTATTNGDSAEQGGPPPPELTNGAQLEDAQQYQQEQRPGISNTEAPEAADTTMTTTNLAEALPSPPSEDQDSIRLPPHRMTTRARARPSRTPSTPARFPSPAISPASRSSPPIHPFFQFPSHSLTPSTLGLPSREAADTRAFLSAYVQRQEEVVRGAEELYMGLLRAEQMRNSVLEWCKAEAHVGEMSDGEDWVDGGRWGLEGELVKGRWEEDEEGVGGKKTRGRRERG